MVWKRDGGREGREWMVGGMEGSESVSKYYMYLTLLLLIYITSIHSAVHGAISSLLQGRVP